MGNEATEESSVRNYLQFLQDPSQLIDQAEIDRLTDLVGSTTDPIARLQAVNRLEQLRHGDGEGYREAFIAHARSWADANGILAVSFLAMGVDDATLRAAGFPNRSLGRRTAAQRHGGRRSVVRVERVKQVAREQEGIFILADLAARSGASPMTIRKAVEELLAAGELERLGPTPDWSEPGRAPVQYRRLVSQGRRTR